ncbi:glycosyltransferase [Vibrio scophthalmi]|uniref:glycosyltransferase n=1 Tax=Vibrio scophthalmi TaxID=45658 RepID=UPI003EBDEB6C
MEKNCILILGMHRSGTSALTKVFNILGADLPTKLLPPVENNNTLGFFEPKDISALHDKLLASADSKWDDITRFPSSWYETEDATYYQNEIIKILERDFDKSPLFVIKDPRVCRIVPFWRGILKQYAANPKFILTVRNPLEVINSLKNRDGFSAQKSVLLWLSHFIEAERETRGLDRAFTTYFHLMDDWKAAVGSISISLNITLPINSISIDNQINEFLSLDHRHHTSSLKDLLNDQTLVGWVKDVYQWTIDKVNGNNPSYDILDNIFSEMKNANVAYGAICRESEKLSHQQLMRNKYLEDEITRYKAEQIETSKRNKALQLSLEFLNEKISINNITLSNNETLINSKQNVINHMQERLNTLFSAMKDYHYNKPRPNVILNKFANFSRNDRKSEIKKTIELSGLFDQKWYLENYRDVEISGIDPITHYIEYGVNEGRNPSDSFNTLWYLEEYTDVLILGVNPLYHYIIHGQSEGRQQCFKVNSSSDTEIKIIENNSCLYKKNHIENKNGYFSELCDDNYQEDSKTILLCAHYVGDTLFGGERSFLDMLEGASDLGYNVVVALPSNNNQSYYETLKKHAHKIIVFPYQWWKKNKEVDDNVINSFHHIIQDNKIDIVHVNTIMLREPLIAARKLEVPSILHVRELIAFDPDLCEYIGESSDEINTKIKESTDYIFANSFATAESVYKKDATFVVPNTVDTIFYDIENKLNLDDITIALISSNIPKKGIGDFIDIARKMEHLKNVRFLLIGPINDYIYELLLEQINGNLPANVEFTGYFDSPIDALAKANIILNLSAFQESFGRTIAEAMASRRPVVAYDWGALPELIQDGETGYLAPFKDTQAIVDKLKLLCSNPASIIEMGEKGRQAILKKFDKNAYARRVNLGYSMILNKMNKNSFLNFSAEDGPKDLDENSITISVIVPNYNYSRYIKERLDSILNQTYKPMEIIFLDDASSDDSIEVAELILSTSEIESVVIKNDKNKGVFKQWLTGIEKAKGDYVWIAEADDTADVCFLQELVARVRQEKSVIAYCQSQVIDGNGDVVRLANYHHTDDLSPNRWKEDYSEIGLREVVDNLAYRNTIPNASACIIDRNTLLENLPVVDEFKYCGDWILYCALLRHGNISYSKKTLNSFRRHQKSVTRSKGNNKDYLQELLNIKLFIADNFPICQKQIERMNQFLDRDYIIDGVSKNSTSELAKITLDLVSNSVSSRKRFVFITTNNGSHNGGSEVLWIESAIRLRELGHDVVVVIKRWYPYPAFFKKFADAGIKIYFKETLAFKSIVDFYPDHVVISTGCQDEGVEWYEKCQDNSIPYSIINQLTKEESIWPINVNKNTMVKKGYTSAEKVFFTCHNNHQIMEARLNSKIDNYDIHFNPFHMDRNISIPFPSIESGLKIAVPARLLTVHKGQDAIIELLSQDKWRDRQLQINFYGDGPDKEKLVDLAHKLNVRNICFIDRVNDVSKIWAENHIILLASKMEGLPIVLVGAMMCGRTSVVTDVGGHAELVDDNVNGFVAHGTSVRALDDALERAYQRKDEVEKLGSLARNKILSYMPVDPVQDYVNKLLNLISAND